MMDDPLKVATAGALLRLLEPLSQLALEVGVGVGDVQALIERAFVTAAVTDAREGGDADPENVGRIAVRTGLHRSNVRELLAMSDQQAVRRKPFQNFAVRVLQAWCTEPDYLDPAGTPKILPLRGPAPSFQALIKVSVGEELSRTILKELQRIGAVRRVRSNRVQLVRTSYGQVPWTASEITTAAEQLREHIRALMQVLQRRPFKPFYRCVTQERLNPETAAILDRDFSSAANSLIKGLESALTQESQLAKARPGPRSRLSAQILILREPVLTASERVRPARAPRRPGRTPNPSRTRKTAR